MDPLNNPILNIDDLLYRYVLLGINYSEVWFIFVVISNLKDNDLVYCEIYIFFGVDVLVITLHGSVCHHRNFIYKDKKTKIKTRVSEKAFLDTTDKDDRMVNV